MVTPKIPALPLGEPRPANVAELEAELSALWRSAAGDPAGSEVVTRACALTLLVYVESEAEGREVSNLIGAVTAQNPCRAIVIVAEPQATPAGISAAISVHCHLPVAGAKQLCSEQITLSACGDAVENLDNVVLPLLVPALPVHLWWRASHLVLPRYFGQILRASNHMLLDSARFAESEAALPTLAAEIRKLRETPVVSDLNWARITPWRELLAQFFDSPETRPYLDFLREVRVEYNRSAPGIPARRGRLLLLTAWLASRLNWEPVSESREQGSETRCFRFKAPQGFVQVSIAPRQFEEGGPMVTFLLASSSPSGQASFWLASALGRGSIVTRMELPGRPPLERTVHLPAPEEVELVNEELKLASRGRSYLEALEMVARMASH